MAYGQWIRVALKPVGFNLLIRGAQLSWGKFHVCGNKDSEIPVSEINKIDIKTNKTEYICSCGRSDAASGTQGGFDLYDGTINIATFCWDCPWSGKNSTSLAVKSPNEYTVTQEPSSVKTSGAIENVTITITKNSA